VSLRVGFGITVALAAGTLAAGCGSDEGGSDAESKTATPQQAVREIAQVRKGLEQAVSTYKSGDKAAADEQVGDAYLEHFEIVEGPLGEADHELTEELEDSIREELREKIKAGAPAAEIDDLHQEIVTNLDKAETALR
jgi:hypothetical protein